MVSLYLLVLHVMLLSGEGLTQILIWRQKRHVSSQEAAESGREQGSWKLHAVASR